MKLASPLTQYSSACFTSAGPPTSRLNQNAFVIANSCVNLTSENNVFHALSSVEGAPQGEVFTHKELSGGLFVQDAPQFRLAGHDPPSLGWEEKGVLGGREGSGGSG